MRKIILYTFIVISINSFGQAPTVSTSNLQITNIKCNQFDVTWTSGNGGARVVFVREDSPITDVPEQDNFYNDDVTFGGGEEMKTGNATYCVYRGTGNSVTVKGLKNIGHYYVAVFEFNSRPGGFYDYLTSSFPKKDEFTKNITANFEVTPGSQCLGNNVFTYKNTSSSDLSPMTFKWNFGDGVTSTNKDETHSYLLPNIYFVKLEVFAPGCYNSIVLNDTAHPHPIPKFGLDPTKPKNDSIQCFFGNRFTFSNDTYLQDIGAGKSFTRYEWLVDTFTATGYKADVAFTSPGIKRVQLITISNRDCRDTTYKFYKVLPRAIDPDKVVINPKAMCLSSNKFTFTNNSPLSVSHSWYLFNKHKPAFKDSIIGLKTATYSFKDTGTYRIVLKSYDAGGCIDVLEGSVEVSANTNITFTIPAQFCKDAPAYTLSAKPGKGVFWGPNVNEVDSTFTPAQVGTFRVAYIYTKGSCRDTIWRTTKVDPRPSVNLGNDRSICADTAIKLSVDSNYTSYWSLPGGQTVTGSSIMVNKTGLYSVRSVQGLCESVSKVNIKALSTPTIKIDFKDTTLCGGSYLKFNLKVDEGTVTWSDGNTSKERQVTQSGNYYVTVENKCGSATDSFNLNVEETACIVFFPNAFSPNGDMLNDIWQPFGKYEFIQMTIFNRWGEQLYFSDKNPSWNGYANNSLCQDGVYTCVFEYLMQSGNTLKKETKGINIHLLR